VQRKLLRHQGKAQNTYRMLTEEEVAAFPKATVCRRATSEKAQVEGGVLGCEGLSRSNAGPLRAISIVWILYHALSAVDEALLQTLQVRDQRIQLFWLQIDGGHAAGGHGGGGVL
jgi:hypothetical protein